MAWLYQRKRDGGTWWIGSRINGRQILKSTGEHDKKKAVEKLRTRELMEAAHRAGKLDRELFEAITGTHIETVNLFGSLDKWVLETTNENTRNSYANFAKQFKDALPYDPVLADITHEDVRTFLAGIRAKKRPSTANLTIACAKAFFGRFKGSLRKDPTDGIPRFKQDDEAVDREAFSQEQIRSIVKLASPFWRCASAVAFYTGLRLSNVARLKVGQVNLMAGKLCVARTIKTGAKVEVKLPDGLLQMLKDEIPAGAKPDDFIWPEQAAKEVTLLSAQFGELLIKAGIRQRQDGAGNGLTGRRTVNALTFHSLRHAFVSALANAGVNQQTVKQLVGHANTRINDAYTHIGQETLDKAADALPNIIDAEAIK